MPWTLERPDPALAAGIGIGGDSHDRLARDAIRLRERLLATGLGAAAEVSTASGRLRARIRPDVAARWAPGHDTTALGSALAGVAPGRRLDGEILAALLLAPERVDFPSVDEFESALRIRHDTATIAARAALAFDCGESRPDADWRRDAEGRFVLRRGRCLIESLERALHPAEGEAPHGFGCYRATECVMLLAIAREAARCNPALLERLRRRTERRPIQSREFHDAMLREHGTADAPLPARWFVPGDRVWFRNPDERSADAEGFEGSWVIYLGGGLFGNFWERGRPFTLERKCVEIHHWRDAVRTDAQGRLRVDEAHVAHLVDRTFADPDALAGVLRRMQRWRDPRGTYADGGCLDRTRECARWVRPGTCDIALRPARGPWRVVTSTGDA
jgi:hypothetical protein